MKREMLPEELLWDEPLADGTRHASELALAALADGEDAVVPRAVRDHAMTCAACTQRLGEAALLSMNATRAIRDLGPLLRVTPVPVSARKKLPVPMIAAALVLAVVGATPTLLRAPARMADVFIAFTHALPVISRGSALVLQRGLGPMGSVVTCACAVLLLMTCVALTRLLPKPVSR